ncbi:MAG: hypothetical protein NC122_04100 [Faecalibacterium sp.]|nr:hypothetical protein [Ruminococcus sp.]MCM1391719.1 hypothetical protein [Ruminococcus sp.]MCM1485368.1 hypothetical protein [Faecalibacterium sp.]
MSMKSMEELKMMLCNELDTIAKRGGMSVSTLETVHKLTDTIKNIDKIIMLEEDGGYSQNGDWEARGSYGRESSYANRRGTHYVRGHYSRDDGYGNDGYSNEGGNYSRRYSRGDAKSKMIEKLERMMNEADNMHEREIIEHCIMQLENA